jgi:hypothetical protein
VVGLSDKPEAKEKAKDYRKEVKKELKEWLELLEAAEQAPVGEVLFDEKAKLGRETLLAFPRLIKIYLQLMVDSSDYLTGMPREDWDEFRGAYLSSLDSMPLGDAVNAYFRLSRKLWEDDAEALVEAELKLAGETLTKIDFGKVRKAMEVKLEGHYPVWEGILAQMVGDPIIIANLLTSLPAFANMLIKLLSNTLQQLDLPSEILASALFNLLEALDIEELGRLVSGIGATVNSLHEGDLVLGLNEPRFREVAGRLIERYMSTTDWHGNHEAMVALSQDLEVLIQAVADAATARPEVLAASVSCVTRIVGSLVRGLSYYARRMESLPDSFYLDWGRVIEEQAEVQELGNLLNSLLVMHNRLLDSNPELLQNVLGRLWSGIDLEELKKAMRQNLRQTFAWLAGQKDLTSLLEPGEAGKLLNSLIATYNRSAAAGPGVIRDYLGTALDQIDPVELGRAMDSTATQVVEAVTANPALVRVMARSTMGMVWKMMKGLLGALLPGKGSRRAGG